MSQLENVVIVGGGIAGANAAFALRDEGFEGTVTLIGEETEWPYERPPLSKSYLRGEDPIEKAHVRPSTDYTSRGIDVRRETTADAIDVAARMVKTGGGDVSYDALVLATGAAPRQLKVPGSDLAGIHYLRTVTDSDALRAAAQSAENIVVVGGGWIGSEVAASLRQLGRPVTFLTSRERPLAHVLDDEVAEVYRRAHLENGMRFETGRVARIVGRESVEGVETEDGNRLQADLIVVGIGAAPRSMLARDIGIELSKGAIIVDEHLRAAGLNIYAIGDVAKAWNPRYRCHVHVEHWDNAIHQGKAVARAIVGRGIAYDRVPYLYSDQYDVGMEYRGFAPDWDQVVVRGSLDAREFHAFWLRRGRVAAAMNVNLWDDGDDLQALVEAGAIVDPRRLSDVEVPLAQAA